MDEGCGCISCTGAETNMSPEERRRHQLILQNGRTAAEVSEKMRLGLISTEDAQDIIRRLGR